MTITPDLVRADWVTEPPLLPRHPVVVPSSVNVGPAHQQFAFKHRFPGQGDDRICGGPGDAAPGSLHGRELQDQGPVHLASKFQAASIASGVHLEYRGRFRYNCKTLGFDTIAEPVANPLEGIQRKGTQRIREG